MVRFISPVKFIKNRLAGIWPAIYDTYGENSDGGALSRRSMLFGNYFGSVAATLMSGLYFTGLLIAMKAGDRYIGYITVATTACGFVQIFSPLIMERMKRRKTFLLYIRAVYYFINIFILGIIPFLSLAHGLKLGLFMGFVLLMNLINSFSAPGFSIWHMQNIPETKRAGYFSISAITSSILSAAVTFSAGLVVDGFESGGYTFFGASPTVSAVLILRAVAFVMAFIEFSFFLKIRESDYISNVNAKSNRGLRMLLLPLKNKHFIAMTSVAVWWTFTTSIIGAYFTVYMLEDLKISYAFLSAMGVFSIPLTIIFTPLWASVIRRTSWLKTLFIVIFFYALAYIGNAFVNSETVYIVYPLLMIVAYIFSPGINLVFSNLPYLKMPESDRTAYLSFYSTVNSVAGVLGAYVGTLLITSTSNLRLNLFGFEMINKQYVNLLQYALLVLLAFYIYTLQKRDSKNELSKEK